MAITLNKALPNAWNTYVPNAESSGRLFVDFSRNKEKFKYLQYVQAVPTQNAIGIWYQMGLDQRARVLDTDGAKYMFPDGNARPEAHDQSEYFSELSFRCRRRSYPDVMGRMMTEQAAWDERDRRSRSLASLAMTYRTVACVNKLTDTTQYPTNHVYDFSLTSQFPGQVGNWATSTSARETIKRTLNQAVQQIVLDTRGGLDAQELLLVMGPDTASQISVSQELVELVKQNANGIDYLRNRGEFKKRNYGLPDRIYDTDYVIEDSVIVTSQRGLITQTAQFIMPFGTVLLLHRPDSIEGVEGGRSFSTCSIHIYRNDDLTFETEEESFNRRTKIAVTDNFDVNMTAPVSGMVFTNVC